MLYLLRKRFVIFLLSLVVILILSPPAKAEKTIDANDLYDRLRGMWLSQLIGNMAGRPTEGWYSGSSPNPADSVPWVIRVQNPSDSNDPNFWDGDDDTDMEYVAMHILEANGLDCNSQEIADQWLRHVTFSGIYIANRQANYLMGDGYIPPQTGSRSFNMHWYAIDSQITTETLGAISPGLTQSAIDLTAKFAAVTNEGFPIHAAQLYAAMYASAFFEPNVLTLVTDALDAIPISSRTYQVAADVLEWYLDDVNNSDPNWRQTRRKLYDKYRGVDSYGRYYFWIESTVNTGSTILALLYGQGDFKETIQIGVLAGWDNDCNPTTAAGIIGIINGFSGLPEPNELDPGLADANYSDVYKNLYRAYLPDQGAYKPQYDTITNIASRMVDLAEQNILANGGFITYGPKTYHIPDMPPVIPEPEKPDPNGPARLVSDANDLGLTITVTAAQERHNINNDRENLEAIINGIIDNSYNGHKAYWSRYAAQPLDQDWYQLNFSKPVKFNKIIFYEGDVVWYGINTYNRTDNSRGGFFEDLTVEILRDGVFISPANLQMSPPLDRYKMYQEITFTFSPMVGDAIRIIGTPGGTDKFTTIMELEAEGDVDPGLYAASVKIASDLPQRSNVDTLEVKFSHDVTITKNDIALAGTTNSTVININDVGFNYDSQTRWLTLSFPFLFPDDTYELQLDCGNIVDSNSLPLLDDDKNPGDGFYTIEFHSFFGDADGSASVDMKDYPFFASRWFDTPGETGMDVDANNILNVEDLKAFAEHWLLGL